jgi:Zn-dependent peptidase ImmA (M78 family)
LHTGGLCDVVSDRRATDSNSRLEAQCNAIAAAMLMPRRQVLANAVVREREALPDSWDYYALRDAATPFGASAEAFARRLLTLGRVDQAFYQAHRARFIAAYQQEEEAAGGGGDFYRNTARDLGKGYVRRIADAYRRRVIDSYTAASFLNVKVGQIDRLAEMAALSGSA